MPQTRAHVYVAGRVQGVSFRYYTQQEAKSRGITGWVRNLPDGRVEAVLEGEENPVEAMVEWLRKGPSIARVDHVEVNWEQPSGTFESFRVRY